MGFLSISVWDQDWASQVAGISAVQPLAVWHHTAPSCLWWIVMFNSLVFQCDDMVSKCREMTSRSKPWFEVATQVVFFPTEEQSTTPKGGRYFSGSLGIQLPRLFGDGPMIAGKTYRVLYRFLCVDCIMLQSSFTWDEIAFEHVQCIIDVTGFRFKATSGSETHINVAPC